MRFMNRPGSAVAFKLSRFASRLDLSRRWRSNVLPSKTPRPFERSPAVEKNSTNVRLFRTLAAIPVKGRFMSDQGPEVLDSTYHKTQEWIGQLAENSHREKGDSYQSLTA